jgi:hypothetical protein
MLSPFGRFDLKNNLNAMNNNGQCHDFNTTMLTFFGIRKCGFGCRCFALVGAFLLHVRTFTTPKHNLVALFH